MQSLLFIRVNFYMIKIGTPKHSTINYVLLKMTCDIYKSYNHNENIYFCLSFSLKNLSSPPSKRSIINLKTESWICSSTCYKMTFVHNHKLIHGFLICLSADLVRLCMVPPGGSS